GAAEVSDGLGMLVGQAAASYHIWRGFTPDIRPVIEYMKAL
ncbi:shikimate dehydrogenase, partial [Neisseria sp. P0009.S007]